MQSLAPLPELSQALEDHQLTAVYQPIVPVNRRRRLSVEALVRWKHPDRGVLAPGEFLDATTGADDRAGLTCFMLATAATECRAWIDAGHDVGVAVNVWPTDLLDRRVRAALEAALAVVVEPERVTVEIVEQLCPIDDRSFEAALVAVARLGARLSLDDFGSGESSLFRLRRTHFDELKIDRVFVRDLATEPTDLAIVSFSVQLGHALGMEVVAEGVETEGVARALIDLGTDALQGYLFARPSPDPVSRPAARLRQQRQLP